MSFDIAGYEQQQRADQILARAKYLQAHAEWTPRRLFVALALSFTIVMVALYLGIVWLGEEPDLIFTWRGLGRAVLLGQVLALVVFALAWLEVIIDQGRAR